MADKKRTYSIAFKREVVEFINFPGNNIYKATKHFSERDSKEYKHGLFSQWNDRGQREVDVDAFDADATMDDIDIIDNSLDDLVLDSDD